MKNTITREELLDVAIDALGEARSTSTRRRVLESARSLELVRSDAHWYADGCGCLVGSMFPDKHGLVSENDPDHDELVRVGLRYVDVIHRFLRARPEKTRFGVLEVVDA